MRIGGLIMCAVARRHEWQTSRKKPGHETCWRCKTRRKAQHQVQDAHG